MMLASSALFVNCTSDPIAGADGTAGIDGTDGIDGIDGLDSTADCRACHSNEHRDPIKADYALTAHATGSSWGRGTSESCAQCHNNEGFIDFTMTGAVQAGGYDVSNPITCTGCHDSDSGHRSFDFEADGNGYALRTFAPVTLMVNESVTLDARNESDVKGASNACIVCHQPRRSGPIATEGKYMNTSSHWGPHHGPQSTLLQGIEGMNVVGSVAYPAPGTAGHQEGSSCIACHMSEGGHSWEPSDAASTTCTSCHDAKPEVTGYATNMEILAGKLAEAVGQEVAKDENGDYQPVFEADGTTPVMVTGIVHDGHPAVGLFEIADADAAWNYLFLLEDSSNGVHNPEYAKALLQNSIESLQ